VLCGTALPDPRIKHLFYGLGATSEGSEAITVVNLLSEFYGSTTLDTDARSIEGVMLPVWSLGVKVFHPDQS
jgi:hypothetical protein